jgi:predicted ester cyclase
MTSQQTQTDHNKAIARRLIEAANAQEYDVFDQLMTPAQAQQAKDTMRWVYATFEGHHIDIIDMVAEGDKVLARVTTRGCHSGDFEGVPPTGKQWIDRGFIYNRFENGKLVESEVIMDALGHLKQLGATISPPFAPTA